MTDCTSFTESLITHSTAPLPFSSLGGESFAAVVRFEPDDTSLATLLNARVGSALILLVTADPGPPDLAEAER